MSKCLLIGIFSLLLVFDNNAQVLTDLNKRFEAYQSTWPKVKLHLIFNQNKFTPGDTVWFKAYFLKEDLTGITGKQLINFDLVDTLGISKLHFIFRTNDGIGKNQFIIPNTLPSGIYLATAYSSWMRNFNPNVFFTKQLHIVKQNEVIAEKQTKLSIAVEGGHLIQRIKNKIAIRTDKGETWVQLMNAKGQEIDRAKTDKQGFGSITFSPTQGEDYSIAAAGVADQMSLPIVEHDGCELHLETNNLQWVNVIVTTPAESIHRNEQLTIVVSANEKIHFTDFVKHGTAEYSSVQIPKQGLPYGVIHISLLDPVGNLLSSRDFYNDGNQMNAEIQTNKSIYHTREKVKLEISLSDNSSPIAGEFSIRVLNSKIFTNEKENSFTDELTIMSGSMNAFQIDRSDSSWLISLDNYLILSTTPIPWKELLSQDMAKPKFSFSNVIEKNGHAYFSDTLEPVPDLTQILFYTQKNKLLYRTFAMDKGRVGLTLPDFFGQDEFFYLAQLRDKEIVNLLIKWDSEPFKLPKAPGWKENKKNDSYASFIGKKRLIDQSFGLYSNNNLLSTTNFTEIGKTKNKEDVDQTIYVKDYITFPTMGELIKEVVPSVFYRKNKTKERVRVQVPEPMKINYDPLYVIDGIATKNTAFFLSLKPIDLIKIEIVKDPKKLIPLGLLGKNGIVIVQTKNRNAREPLNDPAKLIEGLNESIDFKEAIHADKQNLNLPDFRSTIYWNPTIKIDASGKTIVEFYCSDDLGELSIRIDGLTNTGKPFSNQEKIRVIEGRAEN